MKTKLKDNKGSYSYIRQDISQVKNYNKRQRSLYYDKGINVSRGEL